MGFVIKKNAYLSLIGIFALINIFVNINPQIPDYGNYIMYYYGGSSYKDILQRGYESLSLYFLHHQYTFLEFRLVLGAIGFIMLWYATKLWTKNVAWVMAAYLIANAPMDIIQVRNFEMLGFSLLGIVILSNKGNLKYIFSLILVGVGSQFHTLGIMFLPIIFMTFIPDIILNKVYKYLLYITGAVLFTLSAVSKTSFIKPIIGIVTKFSTADDSQLVSKLSSRYISGSSVKISILLILTNIIVWYALGKILQNSTSLVISDKQKRIEKIMKVVVIYATALSPMLFIASEYSRIFRNVGFIEIIFFVYILSQNDYSSRSKGLAFISLTAICISGLYIWRGYFGVLFMS